MLGSYQIDLHRFGDGATGYDKRYLIAASVEIVQMLFIGSHMVWHQHYDRVLPAWQFTVLPDDASHHTVCICEGIESLVFQSAVRHFERLMTAGGLENSEFRSSVLLLSDVIHQSVGYQMIVNAPFAELFIYWEICIRDDLLESL